MLRNIGDIHRYQIVASNLHLDSAPSGSMVYLPPTSRYCSEHATWESGVGVFEWQPTVRSEGDRQNGKCVCGGGGGGDLVQNKGPVIIYGEGGGGVATIREGRGM